MEFNKKQQKGIAIGFVIFIALGWLSLIFYSSKSISRDTHAFYDHSIKGRITDLSMANSRIQIKLDGSEQQYDFNQISEESRKNEMFSHLAEGDSIFHKAYSDTVFIKKDGNLYKYTIFKP